MSTMPTIDPENMEMVAGRFGEVPVQSLGLLEALAQVEGGAAPHLRERRQEEARDIPRFEAQEGRIGAFEDGEEAAAIAARGKGGATFAGGRGGLLGRQRYRLELGAKGGEPRGYPFTESRIG
jgi:hypothetical protein